jgi:hypothetical protein
MDEWDVGRVDGWGRLVAFSFFSFFYIPFHER